MKRLSVFIVVISLFTVSSCSYDPYVRQGEVGGAALGGVAGGLIFDSWGGAAAGAAVGGMLGGQSRRNRMYY